MSKNFRSTTKSAEVGTFSKLSAQRLHKIFNVLYGNLFVKKDIYNW